MAWTDVQSKSLQSPVAAATAFPSHFFLIESLRFPDLSVIQSASFLRPLLQLDAAAWQRYGQVMFRSATEPAVASTEAHVVRAVAFADAELLWRGVDDILGRWLHAARSKGGLPAAPSEPVEPDAAQQEAELRQHQSDAGGDHGRARRAHLVQGRRRRTACGDMTSDIRQDREEWLDMKTRIQYCTQTDRYKSVGHLHSGR